MIVAIADTHAALWYLVSDPRLGKAASRFIDSAASNGNQIGVSAISLAEIVYLVEKARIPIGTLTDLCDAIARPESILRHVPLDESVARKMTEISRQQIPDLPDRIVAATALLREVPLLSRDARIRSSSIQTIW